MGIEIERKFLLKDGSWRSEIAQKTSIKQGYLNSEKMRTVRVRVKGQKGFLTIKGKNNNATRKEFEYEIPLSEAEEMLSLCEKPIIEKVRSEIIRGKNLWEVDEFEGENKGLIVAEIELESEDESFEIPAWIGNEVTHDPRYYNSSLISHPYHGWNK